MAKQYSQAQAYKQLLQITQNILESLNTEPQLLKKYATIKKSILGKTVPRSKINERRHETEIAHEEEKTVLFQLIGAYKKITHQLVAGLSAFEEQIEGQMQRSSYSRKCSQITSKINAQIHSLSKTLQEFSNSTKGSSSLSSTSLILKEELSALSYSAKQFQANLENMALMIQVHSKMHEIILDASSKETQRSKKQIQYTQRLNYMEQMVSNISDVKKFIQQYGNTKRKMEQYDRARKKLGKVLFDI